MFARFGTIIWIPNSNLLNLYKWFNSFERCLMTIGACTSSLLLLSLAACRWHRKSHGETQSGCFSDQWALVAKTSFGDGYSLATQGCLPWNMVATVHDIRRIGYWMARIGSMVAFWWRGNWSQSPGWCQMYDIFGAREWSESMWGYNVTETLAAGFMKFETPSETTYPFVGRGRTQVVKPQKHIKFHFVSVLTIFVSNSSPFIKFKFRAIGGFRVEWLARCRNSEWSQNLFQDALILAELTCVHTLQCVLKVTSIFTNFINFTYYKIAG